MVLLWIEIIHLNGLIFFHTTEPFRIDFHFLNKPQTVNLCLFISVMRFLLGYIWASGRETFCEVLFIKNATATCIKRLYGEAFTKWLDTGRLPKMAVTSNCKQFFFFLNQQSYSTYNKYTNHLKQSTSSLYRYQEKHKKHLFVLYRIQTIHNNGMSNVKNQT